MSKTFYPLHNISTKELKYFSYFMDSILNNLVKLIILEGNGQKLFRDNNCIAISIKAAPNAKYLWFS